MQIPRSLPLDTGKGIFVGGSFPLYYIMSYFNVNINWKSNDTDIFFLDCGHNSRMELPGGNLDFVFCKEKSVSEVLLNFDLPCCRIGFDFKYNFYVSAQALSSIFTKKMYMPSYFQDKNNFMKKLGEFENHDAGWDCQSVTRMIINRFYERVLKYQSRGIKTVYIKNEHVLPWMANRFTYKDFTNTVEVIED